MERLLYCVPEVAEFLGVSKAKVYELVASGALPSVRLDGCRRVRKDALLAYVDSLGSVA